MSAAAPIRSGAIPELQSIRGIAAMVVLFGHVLEYYRHDPLPLYFFHVATNGLAAVVLFFTLSGFVLTHGRDRADLDARTLGAFYIRRLFRIYPAIWAASALGLFYIFFLHRLDAPAWNSAWFDYFFKAERTNVPTIALALVAGNAFILPPLWSIFVELVASAFMPFIGFVAHRLRGWFLPMLLATVAIGYAVGEDMPQQALAYIALFVIGAGVSGFREPLSRLWGRIGRWRTLVFAAGCIGIFLPRALFHDLYPTYGMELFEGMCTAIVISGIVCGGVDAPFLRRPAMVALGDISYGVYLIHFPVMCILAKGVALTASYWGLAYNAAAASSIVLVGTVAVTLPLATLTYRWIEKPGIRIGAGVARAWSERGAAIASARPPS